MPQKSSNSTWPFLDALRSRNGVPPLTAHTLHHGKSSPHQRTGQLKRLWIIVHDLDQKDLRTFKGCIQKDLLRTETTRQLDVVSFKVALAIERNTRDCERELMAERLIRGLVHVVTEQKSCRLVLLGYGDAACTLELALAGGSVKSKSISERVKDVLSNTVGIIFAPFSNVSNRPLDEITGKFESILEKDIFPSGKPMVRKLRSVSAGPEETTLSRFLGIRSEVLTLLNSSFEQNEPLHAPQRVQTDPVPNSLVKFRIRRTETAPGGFSMEREPGTHRTQTHNDSQGDHSGRVSTISAIPEESRKEDQSHGLRPKPCSSSSSPIPLPKEERLHGTMEEEKIARVYFDKWDLQSALHWYQKAQQRLSDEISHHRQDNIDISIASTYIRLGQFQKAWRTLNGIPASPDKPNLQSVIAQCRSMCCTSAKAYREVVECLETINATYKDTKKQSSSETTQMILNYGCLASLKLLLGEGRKAELIALKVVSDWEKVLQSQQSELHRSSKGDQRNLESTEQQKSDGGRKYQCQQQDGDGRASESKTPVTSEDPELVHKDTGKRLAHLESQIEITTKNLLDSKVRLVKILTELGRVDEALSKNGEVLHDLRTIWGPSHVITLRASGLHSRLLLLREDFNEAEATCKNALRCMASHLGSEHYITLDLIGMLVKIYLTQGRWREAHEIAEGLVVRNRASIGETHPQTIESEMDLAYLLALLGKTITAEKFQKSIHEKCEKVFGQHHPTTLISRGRLASACYNAGKLSEAEKQVRDVNCYLEGAMVQDDYSLSIAMAMRTTGSVARKLASSYKAEEDSRDQRSKLSSLQLFKIAEDHLEKATKFYNGALRGDHADSLSTLFEKHLIKRDKEEKVDERLLKSLHAILMARRSGRGNSHPEIATMQHELSLSYASVGAWKDARQLETSSLEARLQAFDKSHPDVLRSRLQLAPILWCVGEMEEAAQHLKHAHDTISKRPNCFPAFDLLSIKGNLANVLLELGEHEKALELQKQLVTESTGKSNHLASRNDLAFIYHKLNRLDLAEQEYCKIDEELENRCTAASSDADPFHMIIKSNKASLYLERGKYAEAEELQRQVKNILKKDRAFGELNRETITSRFNLALILKKRGKDSKAEKQLRKALGNMEKLVGKNHVESKAMYAKLQEWRKGSDERTTGAQVRSALNHGPRRDSGCATSDQTL